MFKSLHPFLKQDNESMGDFISALARQMLTNAENHLVINTPSRVIKYVRFNMN